MTKKEIKDKIREKKKLMNELNVRVQESNDLEEVRSANVTMTKYQNDIMDLEAKLDELEDRSKDPGCAEYFQGDAPENAQRVNGEIRSTYGGGSFKIGQGFETGSRKPSGIDTLALRSDESMVDRLPADQKRSLDLGKYVRGAVTGNWDNAAEERSAMSTSTTGVIIPQMLSAQIIDKARNLSLFTAAEVPVIPMTSNNLTIARVATDPVFAFKEELAEASESSFTLDSVELKAKTAYGYAYVSREAILSASNLSDILFKVFSQAFADMCDRGMLYGQTAEGSLVDYAPAGIMNDTDIHTVEATNVRYNDFIRAIGKIKKANGNPTVVGMNAATEELLSLLVDSNGQVLEVPKAFADLKKVVSNQLVEDENDGSDALVFDPKAMVIGLQNQLVFRMFQDTDYCIKRNAVGFQIYAMLDCVATQPKHIAKITGIKEVEPEPDVDPDNGEE